MAAGGKADTQGHLRWHQKAKLKQLNPSEKVVCSLGFTDCVLGAKAPNLYVDTCIYVPGAESCQKSLARKGRGLVLTQEATYNLKYVPELAVLIEKKSVRELEVHCAICARAECMGQVVFWVHAKTMPGASGTREDQEAPSHGVTSFNQASVSSAGSYDSLSPNHPQCQLVKPFYLAWQWAVGRVWMDTAPQLRGVDFQPRGGNL